MEALHPISNHPVPREENQPEHHCPVHATFNPACDSCVRARAAFLPYPAAPHATQSHSTRSFGFTDQMSEASIHDLARPLRDELCQEVIREMEYEAADEILGPIFPRSS